LVLLAACQPLTPKVDSQPATQETGSYRGPSVCVPPSSKLSSDSSDFRQHYQAALSSNPVDSALSSLSPPAHFTQVIPAVFSGAQPKTQTHWQSLEQLGVRTIVSVDGARPNHERAQAVGLRYIHIPIGYDGIDDEQARALVDVFRASKGPWYFHCHHGKHRGPAAAAVATLLLADVLGWRAEAPRVVGSTRYQLKDAEDFMLRVGTSQDYAGLWRDLRDLDFDAIWQLPKAKLTAQAEVGDLATAMAELDRVYDRLKDIRKAGWVAPVNQPDLSPRQEARIMREGLENCAEAAKDEAEYGEQTDYQEWLNQGLVAARQLEKGLDAADVAKEMLDAQLRGVRQSCLDCHAVYRND
jgi:hypothetical protein